PEGQLWLTAMAERRTEEMVEGFITTLDSGTGQWAYEYHPSRSQDADSLYLEARAPLLARLELQVSGRHDRYRTRAGNFGLGVNVDSPDGPLPEFDYQTNTLRSTDYTVGL